LITQHRGVTPREVLMSTQTRDRIPGAIEHSFILGALEKAQDSYELYSPGTGEVIAEIASCSPEDARRAADLAVSAFANWKARTAFERSAILRKWYELIMDNAEDRKSTRLNSSHVAISYAVFCLKKKK